MAQCMACIRCVYVYTLNNSCLRSSSLPAEENRVWILIELSVASKTLTTCLLQIGYCFDSGYVLVFAELVSRFSFVNPGFLFA